MSENDEPCERCDDSGWVEHYSGGVWIAGPMKRHMEICDCVCGQDVRRELAAAAPTPEVDHA